jgi:hypothetical protein
MSNLYKLTENLHKIIQEKAKKHCLEIEIESEFYFDEKGQEWSKNYELVPWEANLSEYTPKIKSEHILQILIVFKDVLGENNRRQEVKKDLIDLPKKLKNLNEKEKLITSVSIKVATDVSLNFIPTTQSKALDNKWLGTTEDEQGNYQLPLFTREPETVLKELITILKNI